MFSDVPNRPKEDFQRSTETGQGAKLNEEDVKGLIKVTLGDLMGAVDQNLAPQKWMEDIGGIPAKWRHVNLQKLMELG